MKETLGKRIVFHRKRLGLTQDALAEKLGVTAQAVSKWENDQSCPDITTLPRLAEIFCTTTDALLGLEPPAKEAEVITTEQSGIHIDHDDGHWNFHWDAGRKNGIGIAVWVLTVGAALLGANILQLHTELWTVAWSSGLLVFGLLGLWPKFRFFRFGCALAGGYCLGNELFPGLFSLERSYILPIFLLLFGMSLLVDAVKKDKHPQMHISADGPGKLTHHYRTEGETFDCGVSFGEMRQRVELPRLSSGTAEVNFGELSLDLRGCERFAEDCVINADCSFGELTILIPASVRVERAANSSFAEIHISGHPNPDAVQSIRINCDANFGEITLRYV